MPKLSSMECRQHLGLLPCLPPPLGWHQPPWWWELTRWVVLNSLSSNPISIRALPNTVVKSAELIQGTPPKAKTPWLCQWRHELQPSPCQQLNLKGPKLTIKPNFNLETELVELMWRCNSGKKPQSQSLSLKKRVISFPNFLLRKKTL
jgi:hypothetical protein